jgi:hypothetical protein
MHDEQKSLWQTIKPDVAKSVIGAMFITFLSTGFAWFTWYRDKQVNRLEQNIRRIEERQSEALLLTHERWYRAWRLWHELDQLNRPHPRNENSWKSAAQSEVLGVTRTATDVEIKIAFRKAAMQCHPADKEAEARFKEAYQCLCDAQKRARL